MRGTRLVIAAAALAVGLGVAACGSSNTSDTAPVTVTKTQTVTVTTTGNTSTSGTTDTTTTTATGTTTTTSTTGTSTSSGATSHCVAGDLTPLSHSTNGAAGTIVWEVALKNTSSSACATEGYPGVQFLNASGNPIGKSAARTTTSVAGGTIQPKPITLAPGASAYFYVQVNDAAGGGAGCQNVSSLQIYAPDDTVAMKLKASPEIQYCPKLTVTPLQASPGSQ